MGDYTEHWCSEVTPSLLHYVIPTTHGMMYTVTPIKGIHVIIHGVRTTHNLPRVCITTLGDEMIGNILSLQRDHMSDVS